MIRSLAGPFSLFFYLIRFPLKKHTHTPHVTSVGATVWSRCCLTIAAAGWKGQLLDRRLAGWRLLSLWWWFFSLSLLYRNAAWTMYSTVSRAARLNEKGRLCTFSFLKLPWSMMATYKFCGSDATISDADPTYRYYFHSISIRALNLHLGRPSSFTIER